MQEQIENIKALIEQLKIDSAKKQALSDQLAKEGVSDGLMLEIKNCLNQMEQDLDAQLPQEVKDLEQAQMEFEAEMSAIEKETSDLDKQVSKDLDQIDIAAAREALK